MARAKCKAGAGSPGSLWRTLPSFHSEVKPFSLNARPTEDPERQSNERQQVARMSAVLSYPLDYASLARRLLHLLTNRCPASRPRHKR
jgi:hypothetical protein